MVLDLGAGLDRSVRRMAGFADTLLVVATEEPTSLTDAYAALKLHAADRPGGRGAGGGEPGRQPRRRRAHLRNAGACLPSFLGRAPALAGVVRRDERVRDAIRRQTLFLTRHPTAPAAADIEAIAAGLMGA